MAEIFKPLFRGAATTTSSTLYTTPALTTTLINSLFITNTAATSATYSIWLDDVPIALNIPVPANDSVIIEPKQIILATKTIKASASATTVFFHISGLEMS